MAGFEVVVRPAILPNIRPAPPRVLPVAVDPAQGFAVISGAGGKLIDLPHTWSVSLSRQKPQQQEATRQFDKERVHQVTETAGGASIMHLDNYVDIERLKRIRIDTDQGPYKVFYNDPPERSNVKPIETDVTR
jgi:hypothetical protein